MKKYDIIYADPPWLYNDKSRSHGGGAESHYKCISTKNMIDWTLPAANDSVLFMWCTFPMLEEGLKLLKAWGYKYTTGGFTWVKTNKNGSIYMGMGHQTRSNAEICLLGKKGKGIKRVNAGIYNTQLHPRGKHSEKPAKFRKDIEKLYGPNLKRLEMFARENVRGWDAWGDEVKNSIKLEV